MNVKGLYYLFFIVLLSCSHNKGHFLIINNSDFDIDSLTISPDFTNKFLTISVNEEKKLTTNMNRVNTDGSYRIRYKNLKTNSFNEQYFGYYTNGYQIEENILITIKQDTILFSSLFENNY